MTKAARVLALLAGAVTMTLIPCLPALAAYESCRMPGCESRQEQTLTAPDCCCGVANAPAVTAGPVMVLSKDKSAASAFPATLTLGEAGAGSRFAPQDAAVQPPAHVPLFLLHSSLLI